jgi:hypothetical protein
MMRAALEVNELVNGRNEDEPEDSVKEVDIDFTMQENHYILDLPPHLPEIMETLLSSPWWCPPLRDVLPPSRRGSR